MRQQPILELVHLEILLEGKNSSGIRLIVSHAISWASPKLYHMLLNHHIKQQCNGKTLEVSSLHGDEVSVCSEKSSNSSASEPRIKRSWGFWCLARKSDACNRIATFCKENILEKLHENYCQCHTVSNLCHLFFIEILLALWANGHKHFLQDFKVLHCTDPGEKIVRSWHGSGNTLGKVHHSGLYLLRLKPVQFEEAKTEISMNSFYKNYFCLKHYSGSL